MREALGERSPVRTRSLDSFVDGTYVVIDSRIIARKRARWQGRANVERYAEAIGDEHSAQRLKSRVETEIVRRFMRGERLLDVGIGTGRVSLPLLKDGLELTGVDASAAMIERCGRDPRATTVRLVKGELEHLPFTDEAFDTVMSVDTFAHFSDWMTNLDELVRVTTIGGRIIVDVGSRDHIEAVADNRGWSSTQLLTADKRSSDAYSVQLSSSALNDYATERGITLVALVPYGAVFGSLVPNFWVDESYASRSGGIDRLVSWVGADPLLFAFAEFIERRIVAQLAPSVSARMFAVFERGGGTNVYREPPINALARSDERGPEIWQAEFSAHLLHEPNRAFAVAFILAAMPLRLPDTLRSALPTVLLRALENSERAARIDTICAEVAAAWRSSSTYVAFHGVDLADVFGSLLEGELRAPLEAAE